MNDIGKNSNSNLTMEDEDSTHLLKIQYLVLKIPGIISNKVIIKNSQNNFSNKYNFYKLFIYK